VNSVELFVYSILTLVVIGVFITRIVKRRAEHRKYINLNKY